MPNPLAVRIAAGLLISGLALGATGASIAAQETDPIRIGLEAPLTGDLANLGDGMLKGAQLASSQINEAGGLLGRQVEIVPIDDAGDAATGVAAATASIEAGLDGVVGPYNSGVGVETLPLYIEAGLVPIRLTSNATTSGLGYTLQPMTYQIAPVAARALEEWLDADTVAIVYDETQEYTIAIAETLAAQLTADGVEVLASHAIEPGLEDYADVVAQLVALDPDVIYIDTYTPEGGRIAKAIVASRADVNCLADYGVYDTDYVVIAGLDAAQACPVVGVPAPGDFPGSQPYLDAFDEMFGTEPGSWSPYTYDSVNLLAAGITGANGLDASAIEAELDAVDGWVGWTGEVTIDPATGDRQPGTVVVLRADDSGELHVDPDWAAVDATF